MPQKSNANLHKANKAKNDEFYTQYADIQKEINAYLEFNPDVFRDKTVLLPCDDPERSNFTKFFAQNFKNFGLKKLISTSFAVESKNYTMEYQPTLFETKSPKFDKEKTRIHGKIFILTHDSNNNGKIDVNDLEWEYLGGDGDFRSEEVKKLRDEADIIVTNPPFSLFREFIAWIMEAQKKFVIIWNQNAITYKEFFPYIKENQIWLGVSMDSSNRWFQIPDSYEVYHKIEYGKKYAFVAWPVWFTNLDHGRRHQPLQLMTMADNLKFNKNKDIKKYWYQKYDNYNAIEVPVINAIPSDYKWIMWVPISFLRKHCPEQFEILWATQRSCHDLVPDTKKYDNYWEMKQNWEKTKSSWWKTNENANLERNDWKKNYFINENWHIIQSAYQRLFIRKK